ncbi:hypothetical protein GmHk_12G035204 [Glycine max]|nr:hypothetical protein GmHk_12G035204 [Glycine max]
MRKVLRVEFFEGRLWRGLNCWLFLGLLLLLDWWRNVWSAWASSILEGRSRLLLLLLRAGPSEVRVIPPSRVVSVAGEVIIVLLWLILLLRLRRSIVNICSISFRLLNCSRFLHGRAKNRFFWTMETSAGLRLAATALIRQALESVVFHLLAKPNCWLSERPLSTTLLG